MTLEDKLEAIYELEINFEITTFWDCGYEVRLGDEVNGWITDKESFDNLSDAVNWLFREANSYHQKFMEEH